jgi:hypothetical protein
MAPSPWTGSHCWNINTKEKTIGKIPKIPKRRKNGLRNRYGTDALSMIPDP